MLQCCRVVERDRYDMYVPTRESKQTHKATMTHDKGERKGKEGEGCGM